MSETVARTAVVVCGGASKRFGDQDKVFADLAGRPLVRHVTDRVDPVVDEVVVNCHPRQRSQLDAVFEDTAVTVAPDERPNAGPLAGMRRGLDAANGRYAVVLACDMPFVDRDFLAFLFDRAAQVEAALPRQDEGWYQPLQAVYAVEPFVDALDDALEGGVERPIEPAFELNHVVVWNPDAVASTDTFFNVNTPEDLRTAATRIDRS
ncbi:Molybdopterin-guanine dinucleotide biosynthesis protein A [Halanaeroarchaeum sp. HSR-CO]|uniref:molybdenum cofactor guanylyltransferase n=1 Tax=Halanaeroarchaeum sp. HSR-CO TaxID=2866382 RepID=UPI00217CE203|nr:molybdenum cofactor guanylyltransferase [Halanaeroarchaeum sp. HSR-CO]UWG46715.1 Molybdopterin-guanine dinucleotide biosynthesis protein A [Halanaeroarchaeum sp. HSR-CO]